MKRFTLISCLSLALCAWLITPALAQNAVSITQFPFSTDPLAPNMYVACIDDRLGMELVISQKFQVFATPDGNRHLISNWTITGTAAGLGSGWNWYVHGASPLVVNAHDERFNQVIRVNVVLEPMDGGPKLRGRERIRVLIDGDGEVKIAEIDVDWKCLGS